MKSDGGSLRRIERFVEFQISIVEDVLRRVDRPALVLVVVLAAIAFTLSYWQASSSVYSTEGFTQAQIDYLGKPDNRLQTEFYKYLILLIFSVCLTIGIIRQRPHAISERASPDLKIPVWAGMSVAAVFWVIYLDVSDTKVDNFLLALLVWYLFVQSANHGSPRLVWIVTLATLLASSVFSFLFPKSVPAELVWFMDVHWSAILGHGLEADTMNDIGVEAFAGYGYLLNLIVFAVTDAFGWESLFQVNYLLNIASFVFCCLVGWVVVQRTQGRYTGVIALALLLVFSVIVTGFTDLFLFPNQLPYRFLLVPLTLVIAFRLASLSWPVASAIYGATVPIWLLYNFETGLVCVLALGLAMFLNTFKKGALPLCLGIIAAVLAGVASTIVLAALFFSGTITDTIRELLDAAVWRLGIASSGYGGVLAYVYPPFIIIMTHSTVLMSRYLLGLRDRTTYTNLQFQTVTIVALILAFGPYVMNRFQLLNMWVPMLLYALLVLPQIVAAPSKERTIRSFVLLVLIIPFIFGNPIDRTSENIVLSFGQDQRRCLDGFKTSEAACVYLDKKAKQLGRYAEEYESLGRISGLRTILTQELKTEPTLPETSPFFFGHSDRNRLVLIEQIKSAGKEFFLTDLVEDGNAVGLPLVLTEFQGELMRDAGFKPITSGDYWLLWQQTR